MTNLHEQTCEACRPGSVTVSKKELALLNDQVPEWSPVTHEGILMLRREFSFENWAQAMAFTNKVGDLAEQYDHHPEIITEWGKTTVTWWTHTVNGLHKNDFILAAKTDRL